MRRTCSAGRILAGKELEEVTQGVEDGSRPSIVTAFCSRHLLDGGDLEDLDRALGVLAEKSPRQFLEWAVLYCLSDGQVSGIVTALPLSAADDVRRQLDITRNRASRLSAVRTPALAHARGAALRGLDDQRRLLERVLKEVRPSDVPR